MSDSIVLKPVGTVRTSILEPVNDVWGGLRSRIELDPEQFAADALAGIDTFSHVEIVFYLDRIPEDAIIWGAHRPRNREDWPLVGVFAQRSKNRPNRVAVTVCRLIGVDGLSIEVEGLDAIDGTPVIDIKPYVSGYRPKGEVREPAWVAELMSGYWG